MRNVSTPIYSEKERDSHRDEIKLKGKLKNHSKMCNKLFKNSRNVSIHSPL